MTLRGLAVDFGGVLTSSIADAFRAFCRREGIEEERLNDVLHASYGGGGDADSPVSLVEVGAISTEEFERLLAELLSEGRGRPVDPGGLVGRMLAGVRADGAMLDAVRRARGRRIRTGLLSNAWAPRQYRIARVDPGELFDAVVISSEVGMRKPSPEIYRTMAGRLGLDPGQCVFVDDIGVNVEAAESVGMRGVLHHRAEETIPVLEGLLGVELAPSSARRD